MELCVSILIAQDVHALAGAPLGEHQHDHSSEASSMPSTVTVRRKAWPGTKATQRSCPQDPYGGWRRPWFETLSGLLGRLEIKETASFPDGLHFTVIDRAFAPEGGGMHEAFWPPFLEGPSPRAERLAYLGPRVSHNLGSSDRTPHVTFTNSDTPRPCGSQTPSPSLSSN